MFTVYCVKVIVACLSYNGIAGMFVNALLARELHLQYPQISLTPISVYALLSSCDVVNMLAFSFECCSVFACSITHDVPSHLYSLTFSFTNTHSLHKFVLRCVCVPLHVYPCKYVQSVYPADELSIQ